MKRSLVPAGFAIAISIAVAGLALARWSSAGLGPAAPEAAGLAELPPGASGIAVIQPAWSIDPRDDRALVARASHVFVGKVEGQIGTEPLQTSEPGHELPQTQFAVKVLRKIKGNARGTVVVNQLGGIDPRSGRLALIEGDRLLVPGEKVLLITEYDRARDWFHTIAAGYSHQKIVDDQQEARIVGRFARAAGIANPGPSQPPAAPPPAEAAPTPAGAER